jgi:hypothetical protein
MTTGCNPTPKILTAKSPELIVRESRLADALLEVDREFRLLGTVQGLIPAQSAAKVVMAHALEELELRLRKLDELCSQVYESK